MKLLVLLAVAGCTGTPVGRICDYGPPAGLDEIIIASPSLDCVSRTCLKLPQAADGVCTAACERDDDCEAVPETPCTSGFACRVAVTVGPFSQQKMCVCRD